MRRKRLVEVAIIAAAMAAFSRPAAAAPAGLLRCTVVGGFGVVVGSRDAVTCVFYKLNDTVEFYTGSSTKIGLDLGPSNANHVTYNVQATDPNAPALLQGSFAGPGVGTTLGFGGQAAVLVGHTIPAQEGPESGAAGTGLVTLLPSRVNGYTGVNVNVGLDSLQLTFAGSERRSLHSRY